MTKANYVLTKLIVALDALSDDELKQLAKLFQHREVITRFRELLDTTVMLRRAERTATDSDVQTRPATQRETKETHATSAKLDESQRTENLEGVINRLLNDGTLFPTVRDVTEAVNRFFGCNFRFEQVRKKGRSEVVRRTLWALNNLSEKERSDRIRAFVSKLPTESKRYDDYRELFRILAQTQRDERT